MKPMIETITNHHTPASDYPLTRIGKAELTRKDYEPGIYSWEFIHRPKGQLFYQIKQPMPVTNLEIDGKVWMVDDPLHWYGMQEYVNQTIPGKPLLLVGLGLGLAVWQAVKTKASKIYICEISEDVIDLITPNLPIDDRIVIGPGDFYQQAEYLGSLVDDGVVLWDLLVGNRQETVQEFIRGRGLLWAYFPKATRMIFGVKFGKSITF